MNKKSSERKPRKRRENPLSASSETETQMNYSIDISSLIRFSQPFKCKNKTQKEFLTLVNNKEIVVASGPAGVGKSYVAIARALELLKDKTTPYNKLIICKPAIEADEHHGFIPGNLREKMEPHISSTLDIIDELIGKVNRLALEENDALLILPLAFMRGKSLNNTVLIMEEAQNTTPRQMKTLLTRIGHDSKFIISGDLDQSDKFQNVTQSGLYDAIKRHKNVDEIGFIEFSEDEIVRNPVISKILANYKPKQLVPPPPEPPKSRLITEGKHPERQEKPKRGSIFQRILKIFQ